MRDERRFYVYVIFRPNGVPCYVGKGHGHRWSKHKYSAECGKHTNKNLSRIYANANWDLPIVKVRENLTDAEACETEIALIAAIGRKSNGGPLVNLTDGGEGQSGFNHSPETRAKMSAASKGRIMSAETRSLISAAGKGRIKSETERLNIGSAKIGVALGQMSDARRQIQMDAMRSAETRERCRAAKVGRALSIEHKQSISLGNTGKILSPDHRAKLSDAAKTRVRSEEEIERLKGAALGYRFTDEQRARTSEMLRNRPPISEETRAKLSAAAKRRSPEQQHKFLEAAWAARRKKKDA